MAIIEITVWRSRVVNNVVEGPSEQITLRVNDTNNNGLIDRREWTDAVGGVLGHNGGNGEAGALWRGDSAGNRTAGYLYRPIRYSGGEDVSAIMDQLGSNFDAIDPDAVTICFLAGTRIAVPAGERLVQDLRAGDLVMTLDAGPQPLVWVSSERVDAARLDLFPNLRPVKFARGALGPNIPRRPVFVSPQHRVLIDTAQGPALASARHLVTEGMPRTRIIKRHGDVTLVHLALAQHHILLAEGAPMESFFPGPVALRALPGPCRDRLKQAIPGLTDRHNPMTPARPFLTRKQVRAALSRMPA
ncbi:Hint domain-containing protein [Paracoccus sp. (in: a-proteobacteria)]|uniref:Hint domain-containing protein n=1 Tax=Paracoccus sp. TaxID=267 RepID=UPI0026DEC7CB|nr:Hint domain-containing protein [Paracoccus sp. (in: a-proteobacteria)]MDO5648213.1 Hint domain-containing protein [Paracoccus sp. (in: a-proteobacteria)]